MVASEVRDGHSAELTCLTLGFIKLSLLCFQIWHVSVAPSHHQDLNQLTDWINDPYAEQLFLSHASAKILSIDT
jgi:hypothetical protein